METDINQPKSRAFNLFLRLMQLGLSLAVTVTVAEFKCSHCIPMDGFKAIEFMCGATLLLGIVGVITIQCSQAHPKCAFFTVLILTLLVLGGIVLTVAINYKGATDCAYNEAFYRYYLAQIISYVVIGFIVLLLPFFGAQRYSNSPGNLAWALVFLSWIWKWRDTVSLLFIILTSLIVAISVLSLTSNGYLSWQGVSTGSRLCIKVVWMIQLALMVVAEIVAAIILTSYQDSKDFYNYEGNAAIALLWSFLGVNLVDFIFWVIGMNTLEHQRGDKIRDELLQFGKNNQWDEVRGGYLSKTRKCRDVNP